MASSVTSENNMLADWLPMEQKHINDTISQIFSERYHFVKDVAESEFFEAMQYAVE